eukprot:59964_1
MYVSWLVATFISYPLCIYCSVPCACIIAMKFYRYGILLAVLASFLILLCIYEYFTFLFPYTQIIYETNSITMPFGLAFIAAWLSLNIIYNYIQTILTSSKFVKDDKLDDQLLKTMYMHDPDLSYDDEDLRYCDKCKIYKPWRTKHCSVCNACILKLDHHCPFTANCIGYNNYRYFYMFLFYLCMGALFYICVGYEPLFDIYETENCSITTFFFRCNYLAKKK